MKEFCEGSFKDKKLFILDMDGTFYLGDRIFEGSVEFFRWVKGSGREILFFTNNASRSARYYVKKLNDMGCPVKRKNIMTSGDVAIRYLLNCRQGKKVYLLGTRQLKSDFARAGVRLADENPDIVMASFDLSLTYEKVSRACRYIRQGAEFLATHMDLNCPTEEGFIPDCGSICAMLTASTGVKPRFLGKPERETIEMIADCTGIPMEQMVVVGDRLYTDIAMGARNGITSVLVLTGETREKDLQKSSIKPDYVFSSIKQLLDKIKNICESSHL